MKYDPETKTLRFSSEEEVVEFHVQLTDLVREATVAANRSAPRGAAAVEASRQVLKQVHVVARALNALRRHLPRTPG